MGELNRTKNINRPIVAFVFIPANHYGPRKATAKLTLLSGTEKQEVELKASGDKLEALGSFKLSPGTKVVAVVSSGGKQATARFVMK